MTNAPGASDRSTRKTRPSGSGRYVKRTGIPLVAVLVVLLLSFSGWANKYQRGDHSCDFSYAEREYRRDSEDLANQYFYGECLVVKGEDARGLALLYQLADHKSHVMASYFIAEYLETDGRFDNSFTEDQLDESIGYYLRTQALIALIPDYPEPDYFFHERYFQMELESTRNVLVLYLSKYDLGAVGDYRERLLQSPSYQGDREISTYPKYNSATMDSLNKLAHYAGECANLPQKKHFHPKIFPVIVQICSLSKELAFSLIPLEEKRKAILLQPHCKDLNKNSCPEYYETDQKIAYLIKEYNTKEEQILKAAGYH